MKKYGLNVWRLSPALLGALLAISPVLKAADEDSEQVSKLLSDAKTQAFQLKEDAGTMESYTRSNVSWAGHVDAINMMKEHVNAVGKLLAKLDETKGTASAWQKTAIDRIRPLLTEMAANTTATIQYLNKNPNRIKTNEYRDYLEANSDFAGDLASMIADFVDYGKTKDRLERLTKKLEL